MRILTFIPARRDSKGIPGKNWKTLGNKPLIAWSLEIAKQISSVNDICVSSNSEEVISIAKQYAIPVPFKRPEELATDVASTREATLHALNFYEQHLNKQYDAVLILQPTNPFRKIEFIKEAVKLFTENDCDMVVSVYESPLNPYYNVYTENNEGYIGRAIPSSYIRRQDCPKTWVINGNIYVIRTASLKKMEVHDFPKVVKLEMPLSYSVDLDTNDDWDWAEYQLNNGRIAL